MVEEIGRMAEEAYKKSLKERGHVNILIAGRSGVGKSTLINAVFQGQIATTGQGKPVTKETKEYTKKDLPISIFDTRGLEMAAYRETTAELERFVQERTRESDVSRHIHVAWLCIQEDSRRVEDAEILLHEKLSNHVPVLGVITKSNADQGFRDEVCRLLPKSKNVIRVRAIPTQFDDGHTLPVLHLEELVGLTAEVIPEGVQKAFAAAQKASISYKEKIAIGVVAGAAAGAAAAGATPIPFSDALLLVPIQLAMLGGITATFGLELSTGFLATLISTAVGATGATFAGRAVASNLLKLIPGVGSLAGGAISATTAATLTSVLGGVYIATLVALFSKSGGELPDSDSIAREFKKRLTEKSAT